MLCFKKFLPKCWECNLIFEKETYQNVNGTIDQCKTCIFHIEDYNKCWHCNGCDKRICMNCLEEDYGTTNYFLCCFRFFIDEKILCNIEIKYYVLFVLSMLSGIILHLSDVASDIYVLVNLYNTQIHYFYNCLTILCLSFFGSSIVAMFYLSDETVKVDQKVEIFTFLKNKNWDENNNLDQNNNKKSKQSYLEIIAQLIFRFFLGISQISIFIETYYSLKIGSKTQGYIWSRLIEGLIESSPQTLFQLYITTLNSNIKTFDQQIYYFISIFISIVSFTLSLTSFEIARFRYQVKSNSMTIVRNVKRLSYFSPYIIVIMIYRFNEIISRMFILTSFGYFLGHGNFILITLGIDLIVTNILVFLKKKKNVI